VVNDQHLCLRTCAVGRLNVHISSALPNSLGLLEAPVDRPSGPSRVDGAFGLSLLELVECLPGAS